MTYSTPRDAPHKIETCLEFMHDISGVEYVEVDVEVDGK